MKINKNMYRRLATVALLSVLLSITPLCESQSNIVCNVNRRVYVDSDGNLEYDPLPGSTPPDVDEYDPGGLEGWYSLARGFVDAVQPENLPYGNVFMLVWYIIFTLYHCFICSTTCMSVCLLCVNFQSLA